MSHEAIEWFDAGACGVQGKGWAATERRYDRLPAHARELVPQEVWELSRHSSGMLVEFGSDATTLHVAWQLGLPELALTHMPATAVSGLDLYAHTGGGQWRWVAVGHAERFPHNQAVLVDGLAPGLRRYRLYLPLHNRLEALRIGVPAGARFTPIRPTAEPPIVFYGTSIVHGMSASRPGMCHTALLGRMLDRPTLNLGFAGKALMEQPIALLLSEIDASAYVLDPLPNMEAPLIRERAEIFIRSLRDRRPQTPIVMVEDRTYANSWIIPERRARNEQSREAFRALYQQLRRAGDANLHYLAGDQLLGDDDEACVDGSHPSDLGFIRMADGLAPVLKALI